MIDIANLKKRIEPRLEKWGSESGGEYFKPLEKLLEVLYRIGFIGAVKPGKVLYFYDSIPITISDTKEFVIHQAFRSALEVTESIEHMRTVKIGKVKAKNNRTKSDKVEKKIKTPIPEPPKPPHDDSPAPSS